jgi:D-serine deaminase-like pyridoxal phosphate-dependent protein
MKNFPRTQFSALADDYEAVRELGLAATAMGTVAEVLMDLNVGQHRTGIVPGMQALEFYRKLISMRGVRAVGIHAYDGHIHEPDLDARTAQCEAAYAPVERLRLEMRALKFPVPRLVVGGTPTFPIHAKRMSVECSPGTSVLWDAGYAQKFSDLHFLPAAILLTRVVSKPGEHLLCLDLGHKAVASEMAHPRVLFPALPDAQAVIHNEEHMVVRSAHASEFPVGSVLYAIPKHICPTIALHASVYVAVSDKVTEEWPVLGRARKITI